MQPFGENTSNIPAFLGKLWKMVNDPNTNHLICWSSAGNSFVIQNQAQFWYELLPLYYKHNNMSSFVRQLNMYGFHKMSTVENGTMDSDKDEIQFYHRFFQKGQPELLRNIKRKVTVSKSEVNTQNVIKNEDIAKVLTDVKQLRGRQTNVDTQLTAIKQENAVLWRELAMLRQKHIKQTQIVNKLIQFLVTLVQPTQPSRMGVVKRRMPLMLHESPSKRAKGKKSKKSDSVDNGPTIHELDSEIEISPEELFEGDVGLVASPNNELNQPPSVSSSEASSAEGSLPDNFWDKPDFVLPEKNCNGYVYAHHGGYTDGANMPMYYSEKDLNQISTDCLLSTPEIPEDALNDNQNSNNEKVFLTPNARDTLLTGMVNEISNNSVMNAKDIKKEMRNGNGVSPNPNYTSNADTTVATRDFKINSGEDLDLHLESAQTEIESLRDILHGYPALDTNTLLGLFNEESSTYGPNTTNGVNGISKNNTMNSTADPMLSGSELVSCGNIIDFNELFDDTLDGQDNCSSAGQQTDLVLGVKAEPGFLPMDKNL